MGWFRSWLSSPGSRSPSSWYWSWCRASSLSCSSRVPPVCFRFAAPPHMGHAGTQSLFAHFCVGRTLSRKLHDVSMAANLVRYVVYKAVHVWSHILLLVSLKVTQFQEVCDPVFRLCSDILHMQHFLAKVTALPENGQHWPMESLL